MDAWPSGRLHLHWLWVAAGTVLMLWGVYLALEPNPELRLDFANGDKVLHALGFACLMGWWGNVFVARRARIVAALGCLAYGALIEGLQWLNPPRTADVLDVLADVCGIGVALLLLRTPLAGVLARVERTLHAEHG
jgi:VanZ family protein